MPFPQSICFTVFVQSCQLHHSEHDGEISNSLQHQSSDRAPCQDVIKNHNKHNKVQPQFCSQTLEQLTSLNKMNKMGEDRLRGSKANISLPSVDDHAMHCILLFEELCCDWRSAHVSQSCPEDWNMSRTWRSCLGKWR